ncbi:acylphosphatase [Candidatus Peregrinibacteria bacterium]|nr:acylphosphatase [Candidatus Peregrinibacteria bacterium]
MKQAILKITGRVQGVFFRDSARKEAQRLDLTGYAKNMPDDSVEAFVQGEKENIKKFIEWCKEGPSAAEVENIQVDWQEKAEEIRGFSTF